MDIANYIGQFLLKNHFCYIHGLGNMVLKKRVAVYDGAALEAPSYEVVVTPGGSIDDNLANFIATNEQISISKASNFLRDYSIKARSEMQQGEEVVIPNIGKFTEVNGRINFLTDPNLQYKPPAITTMYTKRIVAEEPKSKLQQPKARIARNRAPAGGLGQTQVIILVVVGLLIVAGIVWGIYYMQDSSSASMPSATLPRKAAATAAKPADSMAVSNKPVAVTPAPVDSLTPNTYKLVIGEYALKAKADKRVQQIQTNGNKAEMVAKDSSTYLVMIPINCRPVDTTHVIDSLHKLYGYKKVGIYK